MAINAAFDSVHESAAALQNQISLAERRYEDSMMKTDGYKAHLLRLHGELHGVLQRLDRYLDICEIIVPANMNHSCQSSTSNAHRSQHVSRALFDNGNIHSSIQYAMHWLERTGIYGHFQKLVERWWIIVPWHLMFH